MLRFAIVLLSLLLFFTASPASAQTRQSGPYSVDAIKQPQTGPFGEIDISENMVVAKKDNTYLGDSPEGKALLPAHDRILEWPDRPGYAKVYQGKLVGLYNIAEQRFVVPLTANYQTIEGINNADRLLARKLNENHVDLLNFQGKPLLQAAFMRVDGPGILSVQIEEDNDVVQLYDLDGKLLWNCSFSSRFPSRL